MSYPGSEIIFRAQKSQKDKNIQISAIWKYVQYQLESIKSVPKLKNCMRFRSESEWERPAAGYEAKLTRTANGTDNFMFCPKLFLYIVFHMQTS